MKRLGWYEVLLLGIVLFVALLSFVFVRQDLSGAEHGDSVRAGSRVCRSMARIVIATWYVAAAGAPLFCGGTYNPSETWVALPQGGDWECGQLVALHFLDGSVLVARVRDTGPFGAYCVIQPDGSCIRIGVDVPRHAWPREFGGKRSAAIWMFNISAEAEKMGLVQ